MFRSFFISRRWLRWSVAGTLLILAATWYRVQLNVQINDWFGTFYDSVQKMLEKPGSVSLEEFNRQVFTFARIAGVYILVVVVGSFINKHYVFRWRTAMTEHYMRHWPLLRDIEGASQRIQEDTMRFATIMESLGESGLRAVLTLVAFLPILWKLSEPITELPLVGHVDHSLVYVAILASLLGTVALVAVGCKLPGLEFDNQKVEAAYRKELVLGEDDAARADEFMLAALFQNVRRNYFRLYWHYLYFDVARYSYLQFSVVLPYLAMGPALVAGTVALGVMQQIVRAFGQVLEAFQFLVRSWPTIVELMSIYKRLKAFEHNIVGRPRAE